MGDEAKGLTKWQIALAVGGAAAAVVGVSAIAYVALRSGKKARKPPSQPPLQGDPPTEVAAAGGSRDTSKQSTDPNKSLFEQAQAIKQRGNDLYKQKKYDEAIQCYKEAISVCPEEEKAAIAQFHQNIAAAFDGLASSTTDQSTKTTHLESVVENCTQALELNPRYIKALTRRTKAYDSLGLKKKALLDVTRVLVLEESQAGAMGEIVASLIKSIGHDEATAQFPKLGPLAPTKHFVKAFLDSFLWQDDVSEEKLKELWLSSKKQSAGQQQVQDLIMNEDQDVLPEVAETQNDVLAGFGEDPFVRAAAMFRSQQYHGIVELLTEAVENGSAVFLPHAQLMRGTMYILWRQNDHAIKDLTDVINTEGLPNEMVINALIKKASMNAGDTELEKVHACFEKCLALDPTSPDALIHKARVNLESSHDPSVLHSGIETLEKVLERVPESSFAAFTLATSYHRLAGITQSQLCLQQAMSKFEDAGKRFPDYVDGMVLFAMYLQDMGQLDKAESIMTKAARTEPDNSTVHFTLGILNLMSRQNVDKAIACMEKAISVDNSCIQAYDTLASIEMQKGNVERSMELYERAIQFCRTQMEMGQALMAREIISAQLTACRDYGITIQELASRAVSTMQM